MIDKGERHRKGLSCPACGHRESKVVDSRVPLLDGSYHRRRRECCRCGVRYATHEKIVADGTKPKVVNDHIRQLDRMARDLTMLRAELAEAIGNGDEEPFGFGEGI